MKVVTLSESFRPIQMTPDPDARHDMEVSLDATMCVSIPSPPKNVCPSCGRALFGILCNSCHGERSRW